MKEMCNQFVCDTPDSAADAATLPATEGCDACVRERIGLAQAFVPSQPYEQPMEQEQSLVCGTVFSELVMPYCSGWHFYQSAKEA